MSLVTARISSLVDTQPVTQATPSETMKSWLKKVKAKLPILFGLIEDLHAYYPIGLVTTVSESPSPTYLILVRIHEACETTPGWGEQSRCNLINAITPMLAVYFEILVYCPRVRSDKMPSKWDCTEGSLESWLQSIAIRTVFTSHVIPLEPRILSNYEMGLLITHKIFQSDFQKKAVTTHSGQLRPVCMNLKLLKQLRVASTQASLIHPGVESIIKRLTLNYHVGLKLNGKCFTTQAISEATAAWDAIVKEGGVYIAYRNFMDSILQHLAYLYSANIVGDSPSLGLLVWNPVGESLVEWVKQNNIQKIKCRWDHEQLTPYELKDNQLPLMRKVLQRQDLVYWGVLTPGFESSEDLERGMYG